MAKKGKIKISKQKRNNHTTTKMKKRGELKLRRHKSKVQKQNQPQQQQPQYSSESDEASADEWADMLDEEEQQYILNRLTKQPNLLSNIPEEEKINTSTKKRKLPKLKPTKTASDSGAESDSDVERKYEQEQAEHPVRKTRPLLPIKTKHGLEERNEECEDTNSEEEAEPVAKKMKPSVEPADSDDSGMEGTEEEETEPLDKAAEGEVVSTVQLMAARRDRLAHDRLRIGALCSSLLESPETKLKNLFPILYLMEERLKDETLNLHSIRKLATWSAYEVFKDILPEYRIRHQDYSNIKLKKDTLALYKYEKELLEFYKRYLQRLEKVAVVLRPKKGDTRKPDEATVDLAVISVQCMCGLLVAKPNFNFATNIAQSVVPYLDCKEPRARETVTEHLCRLFAEDNKGDITLAVVRLINQLVKRRGERLNPAALDCLLSLRLKDIELDAQDKLKHKKKQDEKHKKRIVNLSKKEKKRAKKLKEVEKELLETQAQESEQALRKQMTEVTKTVFHIYFRILKTAPRSKLLVAALNGLAKFTHVINLEFYSDLLAILATLVGDELIGPRERLLCVRTVLAILAGAGDVLNVDPARFHAYLYTHMLRTHAGHPTEDARVILQSVSEICARARRVSTNVLQAFAKRLASLATQLQHNGALGCLALIYQLCQQSKAVSSLLETDTEPAGSGRFEPTLESPEHCNAHAATMHELCALRRHYHPSVRHAATGLLAQPIRWPQELIKLSAVQILEQYDGSQMAFKPAIPPPKNHVGKTGPT